MAGIVEIEGSWWVEDDEGTTLKGPFKDENEARTVEEFLDGGMVPACGQGCLA